MTASSCLALSILLTALASAPASAAKTFPPLKRESLLEQTIAGSPPVSTVKAARIHFAPGQPTPPHLHPIPVIGVVTLGSFVFQAEGEPSRVLHKGDAFYERKDAHILRFDNASARKPAEITAFYLAQQPDQPLIQLLDEPAH